MNIIVLVKQVPDTANVGVDAMKADGTVNRAALDAIFNPDDLNALELALQMKDQYGAKVTVVTMGPPKATEILKDSLYRGADKAYFISDPKFAGSDTLATSLVISSAIRAKINNYDIIMAGRQAIDGDTAQVGPQVAEKLGLNQITFVTKIESYKNDKLKLHKVTDDGAELLETPLPILLTVEGDANIPRPERAKRLMTYSRVVTSDQLTTLDSKEQEYLKKNNLVIDVIKFNDLKIDQSYIGLAGSPTRVKEIKSVVFKSTDLKEFSPTDAGVKDLMSELIKDNIIG